VTIEELNERWMTSFWGRTVYEFSEIMIPSELNDDHRFNPAIQLDYLRFMTKSTIDCFENEAQILRANCPNVPVYTNISGFIKKINQFEMIPHMSFAAWDNYPNPQDEIHIPAMKHDIMRGSLSGRPFIVAEQSPNQQNWQPYNKLKRPNEMRLLAYQGIAHGADGSLFFQMRQSIAGQEKFHGAFISHGGKDDTRIFKEFCQLGNEFSQLGNEILGSRVQAKVAMLFDWEN
jgi:beta-galactosidase